jgi:hypothetical protein
VRVIESSRPMLASPNPAGWPLPSKGNEAETSSQDATARALTFPGLGAEVCSLTLWGRLHDSQPIVMINTFQLTRTTKLAWRFPEDTEDTEEKGEGNWAAVTILPTASVAKVFTFPCPPGLPWFSISEFRFNDTRRAPGPTRDLRLGAHCLPLKPLETRRKEPPTR